jgi:hypothetical protein
MPKQRKFYRTTLKLTVLTEDEPLSGSVGISDLGRLGELLDDGPAVGVLNVKNTEQLTGKQMATALTEAGSEPGFFQLDDDGNKED